MTTILATLDKSSSKRIWVWDHFTKCTVSEMHQQEKDGKKLMMEKQVLKAKCMHCKSLFACDTSGRGTSTYIKHINKHCEEEYRRRRAILATTESSTIQIEDAVP
ncbi:unnamed protein product [Cuscuta epithymum]|nr:unnamed protein product [Cuscuta epithymum]